jgi:hypothetical protein
MEIAFVHTGESHDRIHVRRDDGSEDGWRWGAGGPPHDLIHWAVEDALCLRRGFWGLVAGGASRKSGLEGPELMQAEAIVGSIQQAMALDPPWDDLECLRWAATWCEQSRTHLPDGLDVERYGAVRRDALAWVERYRALGPGEALDVTFPRGA